MKGMVPCCAANTGTYWALRPVAWGRTTSDRSTVTVYTLVWATWSTCGPRTLIEPVLLYVMSLFRCPRTLVCQYFSSDILRLRYFTGLMSVVVLFSSRVGMPTEACRGRSSVSVSPVAKHCVCHERFSEEAQSRSGRKYVLHATVHRPLDLPLCQFVTPSL
ncbi:hypothetical protein L227DRAFT_192804 [Lentinus tigrinus ALCF2SS1-6]|uniref:Uncharacterized protein n=1 Tax=Lentinus tigrinus ALCF2SS1-6 TaxID=1328759 RepID=A0A5C2S429_9APHY|nr:hypothetical protein L227DRAFT_192804 [Lentinus tigrinus ALCF2SS1-6]